MKFIACDNLAQCLLIKNPELYQGLYTLFCVAVTELITAKQFVTELTFFIREDLIKFMVPP